MPCAFPHSKWAHCSHHYCGSRLWADFSPLLRHPARSAHGPRAPGCTHLFSLGMVSQCCIAMAMNQGPAEQQALLFLVKVNEFALALARIVTARSALAFQYQKHWHFWTSLKLMKAECMQALHSAPLKAEHMIPLLGCESLKQRERAQTSLLRCQEGWWGGRRILRFSAR